MEGWRQWRLGQEKNNNLVSQKTIYLTPTGLLMEGVYTPNWIAGEMAIFQQLTSVNGSNVDRRRDKIL
jgi:hypothetical protein